MAEVTIKVRQCENCGRAEDRLILEKCPCCGREVCWGCRRDKFPLDKLWIDLCNICQLRPDVKELTSNIEKRWRRFQKKIIKEVESLEVKKVETFEEKDKRLEEEFSEQRDKNK